MNPILILHGWGASASSWQRVKELLEDAGFGVIVPNLPGFGGTNPPPRPWQVQDYAEWIKEFCEKEKLSQVFLLGHSFGGRLAVKFSAKNPEKLIKLILVDSAGFDREKNLALQQKFILKAAEILHFIVMLPLAKNLYPIFRRLAYFFAGTKDYYLIKEPVMKETFKKIITEDLTPHLSQIKTPTLIVWGKKDKLTPLKTAYLIKEKISDSTLEILPDVGHNPHLECPEKLAEIVTKFIKC
jgi:pimeloyl-ACP methyl ester carboxylesterase